MKGKKRLPAIKAGAKSGAAAQAEWVSALIGISVGITLLALLIYAVFFFYTLFYRCDCGNSTLPSGSTSVQSDDPVWKNFAQCKIKLDHNLSYTITYVPSVSFLDGKNVTITGFMQPLEAKDRFNHFLLTRNSPTCAYCPPSKPNEIVEVFSFRPLTWTQDQVTISGTLGLLNEGGGGVFFQMKDAVVR